MFSLSVYLLTWRLKLSHTKTVTAAFHLNNRDAKRELKDREVCDPHGRGSKPNRAIPLCLWKDTLRHFLLLGDLDKLF